jgi:hypothetical protein
VRAVAWTSVKAATKEVATTTPDTLILIASRADSLVIRGASAIRAAFHAIVADAQRRSSKRSVVVAAGLPSLGFLGDAALRAVGNNSALSGVTTVPRAPVGVRKFVHADAGALLGKAADVANLVNALDAWVSDGALPCLSVALYRYWAMLQHEPEHAVLPCVVLDTAEVAFCSTLQPEEDVIPIIDETTGTQAIRTRSAASRPCIVRTPHGGNLASVLQALHMPTTRAEVAGSEAASGNDDPRYAAVRAACWNAWQSHMGELCVTAAIILTLVVLVVSVIAKSCSAPHGAHAAGLMSLAMPMSHGYASHGFAPHGLAHNAFAPPHGLAPTFVHTATHVPPPNAQIIYLMSPQPRMWA